MPNLASLQTLRAEKEDNLEVLVSWSHGQRIHLVCLKRQTSFGVTFVCHRYTIENYGSNWICSVDHDGVDGETAIKWLGEAKHSAEPLKEMTEQDVIDGFLDVIRQDYIKPWNEQEVERNKSLNRTSSINFEPRLKELTLIQETDANCKMTNPGKSVWGSSNKYPTGRYIARVDNIMGCNCAAMWMDEGGQFVIRMIVGRHPGDNAYGRYDVKLGRTVDPKVEWEETEYVLDLHNPNCFEEFVKAMRLERIRVA